VWVREAGWSVTRCSSVPQLAASPGGVPRWEAFPEVNRVVVGRLLGLLVERMVRAAVAGGGNGGERGERCGEAALGAGGG
jgi:hypothetical protein